MDTMLLFIVLSLLMGFVIFLTNNHKRKKKEGAKLAKARESGEPAVKARKNAAAESPR